MSKENREMSAAQRRKILWSFAGLLAFGFVTYSLLTERWSDVTTYVSTGKLPHDWYGALGAFLFFGWLTFLCLRALYRGSEEVAELVDSEQPAPFKLKKSSLSAYEMWEWDRVLPDLPFNSFATGSKGADLINQLHRMKENIRTADRTGYSTKAATEELDSVDAAIAMAQNDADLSDDEKAAMGSLSAVVQLFRDILLAVERKDETSDHFQRLSGSCAYFRYGPSVDEDGRLEAINNFARQDPRIFNINWNSGYHYTTGESSGSAEENEREGAPELFSLSFTTLEKDEEAVKAAINAL